VKDEGSEKGKKVGLEWGQRDIKPGMNSKGFEIKKS